MTSERVLITGGAGFIGTALTRHFLEQGCEVVILDSMLRNSLQYFPDVEHHERLTIRKGDVRDQSAVAAATEGATLVFHLAAIAGVSKYFKIPVDVLTVNILGTYQVLEAIKDRTDVKAFFDFSTSEIYGSRSFGAREESDVRMENLFEKRWTYAVSKVASEKFGLSYHWQYGVPFVGIRPFNIYGPGQVGEGVLSYFLTDVLKGKPLRVTGRGFQSRAFCYVTDFVAGIEAIRAHLDQAVGQSFNIGNPREIVSIGVLADLVQQVAGRPVGTVFEPHAGEDVQVRSPDIERISRFGWEPKVSLREGLQKTLAWYESRDVRTD